MNICVSGHEARGKFLYRQLEIAREPARITRSIDEVPARPSLAARFELNDVHASPTSASQKNVIQFRTPSLITKREPGFPFERNEAALSVMLPNPARCSDEGGLRDGPGHAQFGERALDFWLQRLAG